jgi:hypothetical protein
MCHARQPFRAHLFAIVATALGLLRYALIFVAQFPLSSKIVSWMNKFYMDDVHWKLPQLFYFMMTENRQFLGQKVASLVTKIIPP